ncbi:hypothetical protein [Nonomuraea longicatena]|uniref:Uncharacterized protein n=1 Tax=Nonomuraea longicatena TaxID=83682 RepID=A0ABP3Z2W3_9ACTN
MSTYDTYAEGPAAVCGDGTDAAGDGDGQGEGDPAEDGPEEEGRVEADPVEGTAGTGDGLRLARGRLTSALAEVLGVAGARTVREGSSHTARPVAVTKSSPRITAIGRGSLSPSPRVLGMLDPLSPGSYRK